MFTEQELGLARAQSIYTAKATLEAGRICVSTENSSLFLTAAQRYLVEKDKLCSERERIDIPGYLQYVHCGMMLKIDITALEAADRTNIFCNHQICEALSAWRDNVEKRISATYTNVELTPDDFLRLANKCSGRQALQKKYYMEMSMYDLNDREQREVTMRKYSKCGFTVLFFKPRLVLKKNGYCTLTVVENGHLAYDDNGHTQKGHLAYDDNGKSLVLFNIPISATIYDPVIAEKAAYASELFNGVPAAPILAVASPATSDWVPLAFVVPPLAFVVPPPASDVLKPSAHSS